MGNRYVTTPALDRFWMKVVCDPDTGCWEWTGHRNVRSGYGAFRAGKVVRAHRFAYEQLVGPIPEGLEPDHTCSNPGCVNPDHLEPVTRRVNLMRGSHMTAYLHRAGVCKRGHEATEANVQRHKGGRIAYCKVCDRDRRRLKVQG